MKHPIKQPNDHQHTKINHRWLLLVIPAFLTLSNASIASTEQPNIRTAAYTGEPVTIQTVLAKRSNSKKKKRSGGRGCQTLSSSTLNKKASAYEKTIRTASRKYGVNPALIKSVITVESCFKSRARGTSGEKGLMQLMPGTARRFNIRNGYNSYQNIHGGTQYLSFLLRRYNGDLRKAVAAYNGGEGNVDRVGGVPARNRGYVRKVLQAYGKFSSSVPAKQPIPQKFTKRSSSAQVKALAKQRVPKKTIVKQQARKALIEQKPSSSALYRNKRYYKVQNGDTVYAVMRTTGVPVKQIVRWNKLQAPYHLKAGQVLRIKPETQTANRNVAQVVSSIGSKSFTKSSSIGRQYLVKQGDTLYSIARQSGISVKQLIRTNQLMIPYELKAGQRLQLP